MYFYSKESSRIEDNYKMYSHLGYKGICAFCGDSFEVVVPKQNIVLKDVRMMLI